MHIYYQKRPKIGVYSEVICQHAALYRVNRNFLIAKHCILMTLHHTATHCNTRQHTATHGDTLQHTATHCNTLHHTATHYKTLHHAATDYNTHYGGIRHVAFRYQKRSIWKKHTTIRCITLQHSAWHCNRLQHTPWRHPPCCA